MPSWVVAPMRSGGAGRIDDACASARPAGGEIGTIPERLGGGGSGAGSLEGEASSGGAATIAPIIAALPTQSRKRTSPFPRHGLNW